MKASHISRWIALDRYKVGEFARLQSPYFAVHSQRLSRSSCGSDHGLGRAQPKPHEKFDLTTNGAMGHPWRPRVCPGHNWYSVSLSELDTPGARIGHHPTLVDEFAGKWRVKTSLGHGVEPRQRGHEVYAELGHLRCNVWRQLVPVLERRRPGPNSILNALLALGMYRSITASSVAFFDGCP
jgi:hypothetical protein